jgi:hypothetical protein
MWPLLVIFGTPAVVLGFLWVFRALPTDYAIGVMEIMVLLYGACWYRLGVLRGRDAAERARLERAVQGEIA